MTGQLGNVMSTYANMIAIQWRLGFKYFLPRYMNHHTNQARHHYTVYKMPNRAIINVCRRPAYLSESMLNKQ